MKYLKAPPQWSPSNDNPFSDDGLYGPEWSCFRIDEINERIDFCGSGGNSLFTCCLGIKSAQLKNRLADFLRYENQHGRKPILSFPESVEIDCFVRQALRETSEPNVVRPDDPQWVVHSTTLEAWERIKGDGALRSLSVLRGEGKNVPSVGFDQLGEPPDYADYVVLGRIDNGGEHVVASQAKGFIFTDEHAPYQPGVRLYFDNHRIIESGLAVRDGLHVTKVHRRLSLSPFLLAAISVSDLEPTSQKIQWTPGTFWQAANERFFKMIRERKADSRTRQQGAEGDAVTRAP